ncbi:MAG: heme lyase CcmF/NrfE family subunit [Alphaproteobacteria bacterium]|nr:heme lyase CcmF/NrfE family subunit [Alphaproteobacteria bacterium]
MIAELGHFSLVLALLTAIVQATVPLWGAWRGDAGLIGIAPFAAAAQFLFVALAFFALMHAYVVSDFSVVNVFENSHSLKPILYKLSGLWGNHEGSLILWVLILTLFGLAVAFGGGNLPPAFRARALAVQGMISVGFLAFSLATSNPFLRLDPAPLEGRDLNPLLQDPGLAFHPPALYLGYVGFSMAFSFAIAALIEGRVDAAWARWVRPWTLAAWCALTLGIAMGSWWAYYELGWGGWWFWDPVENASFMPWLAGTALLHSAIVVEKRSALKSWTILLAIITFALSLMGTFLVRSGVLTSVHAFATDPARGVFILGLLVVAIGGSLLLYGVRAPALKAEGLFAPISREAGMVLNNLLLATACGGVLIGTLYPLFLDAVGGGTVSVGPPYFERVFVPLMVPLLLAMAAAPLLPWKRGDLRGLGQRLGVVAAAALALALFTWARMSDASPLPACGVALAAWVSGSVLLELGQRLKLFTVPFGESLSRARHLPRAAWGMTLAHLGVAVFVAGVTASTAWRIEAIQLMRPGDTVTVAGYDLTFESEGEVAGPNYMARRGTFTVRRNGDIVTLLYPEKRFYPSQQTSTTEAAIHTTWLADLYAVLGDPAEGGAWSTRVYYNPLVPWIWLGCLAMVAGGAVSLTDRRHRVGAPVRRRAAQPAAAE